MQNIDWLEEQLGDYNDDYILFDCPGKSTTNTIMSLLYYVAMVVREYTLALYARRNFRGCGNTTKFPTKYLSVW